MRLTQLLSCSGGGRDPSEAEAGDGPRCKGGDDGVHPAVHPLPDTHAAWWKLKIRVGGGGVGGWKGETRRVGVNY